MEETDQEHRQFEEAAPIYATGGLEPKEREEFEAHLQTGCSVCFDLLKELQPTNQYVPDDPDLVHSETLKNVPEDDIPSEVRPFGSRVRRDQDSQTGVWAKVRTILTSGVLALVLVVVAAGSLWYALSGQTDLSHLVEERQRLELNVKELTQRMARFQDQIKMQSRLVGEIRKLQERHPSDSGEIKDRTDIQSTPMKELMAKLVEKDKKNALLLRKVMAMTEYEAFVQSSHLRVVPFIGKRSTDSKGFFLYDPEKRNALFYGTGLPSLPPNAVYQIWALVKKPVSLGTFKLDAKKNGRLWLHNTVNLAPGTKFAVSVERGAGAPKPTGEIQLLGELPKGG